MPPIKELLRNKAVQVSLGVVALIFVGSLTYYLIESAPPSVAYATVKKGDITDDITATGVVSPVQNPNLSFEVGGQVASVNATVGEKVTAGTLLASLDTSVLQASLDAAQAKLNEMEQGPRSVDVAGQQTGVSTAQQTLTNAYANYPTTLTSTLSKAEGAVYTNADPYFDMSDKFSSALVFNTYNSTNRVTVDSERSQLTQEFVTWSSEIASVNASSSPSQVQQVTQESIMHLQNVRTFLNDMVTALNDAEVGTSFTNANQTAALTSVNAARDAVNGLITSLTSANQSLTTQQLAVQSAQDQLNQTLAGSTPQAIQAQQATVAGIEAQIRQQEIVAPFSGTVASVSVKQGDVVNANSAAISLVPQGNFEVDVYLAENDVTKVAAGDPVDVTLDAYGSGRTFPATVSTIDASPSVDTNGDETAAGTAATGYKVTVVFNNADPAIANGMHANVTIHAGSAQNVLLIPKGAVITNGSQTYVLRKTSSGLVQAPVTVGLSGTNSVQVMSGLQEGDTVSAVGAQ
ncbi:MAG: efflux RND transporter periplasmic adaptor subunit [Candidatus Pacebacteria bacterium]|nr:efflux RND transporter periplasmic adaptor subunit [Candidatus Paceibacterota bacterium]